MDFAFKDIAAIFIGGGLGSVARYLVGRAMFKIIHSQFPWGTLMANVLSCILLGIFVIMIAKQDLKSWWIPFWVVGFCGGFSTFSTFSYETVKLFQSGNYALVGANVLISLVVCFLILYFLSKQWA